MEDTEKLQTTDLKADKKRLKDEKNKLKQEQKKQRKEARARAKEIALEEAQLDDVLRRFGRIFCFVSSRVFSQPSPFWGRIVS